MNAPSHEFCTRCGREQNGELDHVTCATALELEPARFCPQCARRMVVQVTPSGWTARCSQHGELASV